MLNTITDYNFWYFVVGICFIIALLLFFVHMIARPDVQTEQDKDFVAVAASIRGANTKNQLYATNAALENFYRKYKDMEDSMLLEKMYSERLQELKDIKEIQEPKPVLY